MQKTNRGLPFLIVLAGIIGVSLSQAFAQGLYWEQTATTPMGGKAYEFHTKGYLKPMKLKTVSDEQNQEAIIRSDREIIYIVDMKDKTYTEMTFKEMEGQMSKASEKMKQMQEKLKDLPPEQRKMVEGMMGEKEYQIKKTGEKKNVAGYSCEKVVMSSGDNDVAEFWVTKQIGSMKEYAKDWSKLMDKMAKGPMVKMYRKLAELDGFVMESKFSGMTVTTTKLEKRSVADSEFEVPAGYTKKEMKGMSGEN